MSMPISGKFSVGGNIQGKGACKVDENSHS